MGSETANIQYNGDIWRATKTHMDVRVALGRTASIEDMSRLLDDVTETSSDITFTRMIPDLQELITATGPRYREAPPTDTPDGGWNVSSRETVFYNAYQPLDAIWAFGSALADQWPEYVTGLELGTTQEGRPIRGWSAKMPMREGETDPAVEIVIQSGQHAREWVGPATALYFLHSLLLDATAHPKSKAATLLRTFTFTVVPMINPDGYVYSHEHNRMWKKNRQDVGGLLCKGGWGWGRTDVRYRLEW